MYLTVFKAQANMVEANLTCLEGCLWRISLCLDAPKLSKDETWAKGECGSMCAR